MRLGSIDFPAPLMKSIRSDGLVVFAGSGVSMGEPARLPNFKDLAEWISGEPVPEHEPIDRFLGRFQHKGVKVHKRAIDRLSGQGTQPTPLHRDLLRLFPRPEKFA